MPHMDSTLLPPMVRGRSHAPPPITYCLSAIELDGHPCVSSADIRLWFLIYALRLFAHGSTAENSCVGPVPVAMVLYI